MLATVESVLFSYFCIYNLGHEEWLSVLCIIASITSIAATAALPGIGRHTGKQTIIFLGCLSMIVSALFCTLATGFWSALLFVIFKGIGYGFCISCNQVINKCNDCYNMTFKNIPSISLACYNSMDVHCPT